jgi:hypothetical protein
VTGRYSLGLNSCGDVDEANGNKRRDESNFRSLTALSVIRFSWRPAVCTKRDKSETAPVQVTNCSMGPRHLLIAIHCGFIIPVTTTLIGFKEMVKVGSKLDVAKVLRGLQPVNPSESLRISQYNIPSISWTPILALRYLHTNGV